jgi:hypothetical protein
MKNTLKLAAIALVAVFVYACSGGSTPETNAKAYLDAMNAEDFDKAKEFCTKETGGMLDMMKSLTASMGAANKDAKKEKVEIKDLKCTVSGDTTAVCTYCCTKEGQPGELKMKKEGDKWLAHQPKENPMGGGEGAEMPAADTSATMPAADTSASASEYK